ncbi:hypothetical protein HMPREF0372_00357 [Flavonifractor plautii ATCC 29863]|uniref:Uncharacterized protein n=1 Tax=Flavonifractor plautii ATCC 29863 TaxID=411475 RepID=G9YLJ1_FLAPL|nr:hypothetical protein HMPREF0372_00357 [Flavonifractor plautii ATCC 29863]
MAPILPSQSKIDKPFFHFLGPVPVLPLSWSRTEAEYRLLSGNC